jgi:hypothetical protein
MQSFHLVNFLEERELFSAWMTIDPTSVQCTAVDDKELLETIDRK